MLIAIGLCLSGCAADVAVLEPGGPVESRELFLIASTFGIMLIVLIPVLALTVGFAWKYRASNSRATYAPNWASSPGIELTVWLIPAAIVLVLGVLTWIYTHRLNPYKPIASDVPLLKVQVIAMDWKWLFIYPDQGVAAVNQLAMPVGRPVGFDITSDTVMNAFFIPQLGGQIYAMAGMRTELHLLADRAGSYFGENTQFSGRGFPDQRFEVLAMNPEDFEAWVRKLAQSPDRLDRAQFERLERPSVSDPVRHFGWVEPGLFAGVINKFAPSAPPTSQPSKKD